MKNNKINRSNHTFVINIALLVLILITAWPVLPMTMAIIILNPVAEKLVTKYCCYESDEEVKKYDNATTLFFTGSVFTIVILVGLFALVHIKPLQEDVTLMTDQLLYVFKGCLNNIISGNILENFKLCLTPCNVLWSIYMSLSFFVSAYFFYRFEKNGIKSSNDVMQNVDSETECR